MKKSIEDCKRDYTEDYPDGWKSDHDIISDLEFRQSLYEKYGPSNWKVEYEKIISKNESK